MSSFTSGRRDRTYVHDYYAVHDSKAAFDLKYKIFRSSKTLLTFHIFDNHFCAKQKKNVEKP